MTPAMCIAIALFFEARGEDTMAREAVAQVIINRVEDKRWPNDACGVVFQRKQFSFTHDGLHDDPTRFKMPADVKAWSEVQEIAADAVQGDVAEITSNHYHRYDVSPGWAKRMAADGKVGVHYFYTAD